MDRDQSKAILDSARTVDRASIFEGNTQKPFNFQSVTLDLSTARLETSPLIFNFPIKCIYVQNTTDSSTTINFKPNAQESFQSPIALGQNDVLEFEEPISKSVLYWAAQAGKSVTIVFIVNGKLRSGKLISVTSGGVSISEGTAFSTSVVTLGAATPGIVAASNSNRTVTTIQNNTAAPIWLGGSSVSNAGANLGFQLGPGQSFQWKNTAVLYAYSVAGGDVLAFEETL